jgi:hypothetical protein
MPARGSCAHNRRYQISRSPQAASARARLTVGPDHVHHALRTVESIATVIIAIYVAFIGTFQWITASEKLRLDLYNRRFDVYLNALDFMQALMMWNDIPQEERHPARGTTPEESRIHTGDAGIPFPLCGRSPDTPPAGRIPQPVLQGDRLR